MWKSSSALPSAALDDDEDEVIENRNIGNNDYNSRMKRRDRKNTSLQGEIESKLEQSNQFRPNQSDQNVRRQSHEKPRNAHKIIGNHRRSQMNTGLNIDSQKKRRNPHNSKNQQQKWRQRDNQNHNNRSHYSMNKNRSNNINNQTGSNNNNSIENLRAVFLKSVEVDRSRREKEISSQQRSPYQASLSDSRSSDTTPLLPSWRKANNNSTYSSPDNSTYSSPNNTPNNTPNNSNSVNGDTNNNTSSPITSQSPREQWLAHKQQRKDFFDSKYDQDQKLSEYTNNESSTQISSNRNNTNKIENKKVVLSNHQTQMDLRTLAGILRVKVEQITKTLIALGEYDASILEISLKPDFFDKRGKFKPKKKPKESLVSVGDRMIDIDMAELVAMELGFEVIRSDTDFNGGDDYLTSLMGSLDDASMIGRRSAIDENEVSDNEEESHEFNYSKNYFPRAPVVSIMGHVDHGKTTLMDALRRRSNLDSASKNQKSGKKKKKGTKLKNGQASSDFEGGDIAGTEAGGITQVISAFQVPIQGMEMDEGSSLSSSGDRTSVTFLDTPGHAAFKAMRQSGSNATDIIVLVVAADDGVSAQTIEIIDLYKRIERESEGNISLVVAMTKIDKEGIDVDESKLMIENQLNTHNIAINDIQLIPVSGITGEGLDDLVDALILQAQVMDLKDDIEARGEGVVMDAKIEKGLGVIVDCVMRSGKLEQGDTVVSGLHTGKVRILKNVNGSMMKKATASQPVRIVGLKSLPKTGEAIICVKDEETAKQIIEHRIASNNEINSDRATIDAPDDLEITGSAAKEHSFRVRVLKKYGLSTNDNDADNNDEKDIYIPIIVKSNADGSLDAVKQALISIGTECKNHTIIIDPIEVSIGSITSNDLLLAQESQAAIFSFGVSGGYDKKTADDAGVIVRQHEVIYSLLEDAKDVFADYLPRVRADKMHGRAVVQAVFTLNGKEMDKIAGLKVKDGSLFREKCPETGLTSRYRVLRDGKLVCQEDGILAESLKKVKEDVPNVRKGEECGLSLRSFSDLEEGDIIECFSIAMQKASI